MITMFHARFCFFSVVTIFCFSSCIQSSYTISCVETEREALLKLKDGFIHGSHILSSWKGEDCCRWKGISCNNVTGHVTTFDLRFSNFSHGLGPQDLNDLEGFLDWMTTYYEAPTLGGKIDSSICELHHLVFLDLSNNDLEGEIPKCIGSLGNLIELKLAWNELVGFIPHRLANLSNLQTLDLRENHMVAHDLEWLSHLSKLRYLGLSNNNLSRAYGWLSTISKIPSLLELCLDGCELPQINPKSVLHMNSSTSLRILDLSNNLLNSSIMSWVVNVSKVLTLLDLSSNSLQCTPEGFSNMSALQYLGLIANQVEGDIIKSFRRLCQLKYLWLDFNKLTGQLSQVPQLCSAQNGLEVLSLGDNPFLTSGPLPDLSSLLSLKSLHLRNTNIVGPLSFAHLPHLEVLDLSFNKLSASLPSFDVSNVASLQFLDLSHNKLNGTIPHTIGKLSNLSTLTLSSNNLTGIISEVHLSSLPRLTILDLAHNSLSFNFNTNWVPPFQLTVLYVSSCILGPQFPTWLKYQRNLLVLQISHTSIIDSFPKWLWNLSSSLRYLNVSDNKISGVLPKSLPSLKVDNRSIWDFSFNNLYGLLPSFPNLNGLFLSNNKFAGFVSSFCPTAPLDLTYLDLSSNLLAGPLLDCWEKFPSLKVLNLEKNNLSGRIPNSFGTLLQIQSMQLNHNKFSGVFPSLTRCSNLAFIDFGDNNLRGALPAWIGQNLHGLRFLHLRSNRIQGSIPINLCNLSFLQVLDLSRNNFTGKIPRCLNQIIALSNLQFPRKTIFYDTTGSIIFDVSQLNFFVDETILSWKGQNREYGKNLGLMTSIDLSCNHLTGDIPESITTLVALAGLNLSGNNLTGIIPNNIGHMKMLESLDLSRNHIYGRIPTSFSSLSFLGYMNLSFNNLSGQIPVTTQLQTFDASTYLGNSGLCGPPLKNQCPGDATSPIGSTDGNGTNDDEDEVITIGFYITLGFGFCVGFWGVCGTLILKSSCRDAYFQFLNSTIDWIYVTLVVITATIKKRLHSKTKRKLGGANRNGTRHETG